jgi:hypothetical protein
MAVRWKIRFVSAVMTAAVVVAGCANPVTGTAEPGVPEPIGPAPSSPSSAATTATTGPPTSADTGTEETGTEETSTEETSTGLTPTSASSTATSPSRTSWSLPNPIPGRPKTKYGDIKAEPGQAYGVQYSSPAGEPAGQVVFVVTKLSLDPTCETAVKPTKGHFLRIDLKVEPRELTDESADNWSGSFSNNGWTAFGSTGQAQVGIDSDVSEECLGSKTMPYISPELLKKGELIGGSVVLDLTSPKGTVILDLGGSGTPGWEYQYG